MACLATLDTEIMLYVSFRSSVVLALIFTLLSNLALGFDGWFEGIK